MHELICSCLQLPPDRWPPDHYTLLGLERGETDTRQIEQRVQERMEKLRRYQLTHAEQVTEGMNRLAQALVCLTDPVAKQAYDALLFARTTNPKARARARRPNPSLDFRFPHPIEFEPTPALEIDVRRFPGWLLLAWCLWLAVGVGGLVAVIANFSNIKASYSQPKAAKRLQEPTATVSSPAKRRGP